MIVAEPTGTAATVVSKTCDPEIPSLFSQSMSILSAAVRVTIATITALFDPPTSPVEVSVSTLVWAIILERSESRRREQSQFAEFLRFTTVASAVTR